MKLRIFLNVPNAIKYKPTKENRGRRRKTSKTTDRRIIQLAKADPFKSSKAIREEIDSDITARTVRNRLVEAKLFGRVARKVPLLSKKISKREFSSLLIMKTGGAKMV